MVNHLAPPANKSILIILVAVMALTGVVIASQHLIPSELEWRESQLYTCLETQVAAQTPPPRNDKELEALLPRITAGPCAAQMTAVETARQQQDNHDTLGIRIAPRAKECVRSFGMACRPLKTSFRWDFSARK